MFKRFFRPKFLTAFMLSCAATVPPTMTHAAAQPAEVPYFRNLYITSGFPSIHDDDVPPQTISQNPKEDLKAKLTEGARAGIDACLLDHGGRPLERVTCMTKVVGGQPSPDKIFAVEAQIDGEKGIVNYSAQYRFSRELGQNHRGGYLLVRTNGAHPQTFATWPGHILPEERYRFPGEGERLGMTPQQAAATESPISRTMYEVCRSVIRDANTMLSSSIQPEAKPNGHLTTYGFKAEVSAQTPSARQAFLSGGAGNAYFLKELGL